MKGDPYRLFVDEFTPLMGCGYWTRSNTEVCLLATRGKPKRQHADIRQGIIAPRREHSRKPDCVYERIERLVPGPYLELFARLHRPGWDCLGHEFGKFGEAGCTNEQHDRHVRDWAVIVEAGVAMLDRRARCRRRTDEQADAEAEADAHGISVRNYLRGRS
jgi:hypothetical protein